MWQSVLSIIITAACLMHHFKLIRSYRHMHLHVMNVHHLLSLRGCLAQIKSLFYNLQRWEAENIGSHGALLHLLIFLRCNLWEYMLVLCSLLCCSPTFPTCTYRSRWNGCARFGRRSMLTGWVVYPGASVQETAVDTVQHAEMLESDGSVHLYSKSPT